MTTAYEMPETTFPAFGKIPRWRRPIVITEKIDGTNGLVAVNRLPLGSSLHPAWAAQALAVWPDAENTEAQEYEWIIRAGSRKRWLSLGADNFGFAAWVFENRHELAHGLGPGKHYGEWYGRGIQRGYGLSDRRFALFNVSKWSDDDVRPKCCEAVPVLYRGDWPIGAGAMGFVLDNLGLYGSRAVPGYMNPEGIVLYHVAGSHLYKVTLDGDEPKNGWVIESAKNNYGVTV